MLTLHGNNYYFIEKCKLNLTLHKCTKMLALNRLRPRIYSSYRCIFALLKINETNQSLTPCYHITTNVKQFSTTPITLKSKDRGKDKMKKPSAKNIDLLELETVLDVEKMITDYEKNLEMLKQDFISYVSLRTNAGALEQIPIKYNNQQHKLEELVRISRKPKEIVMDASLCQEAIPNILEALRSSHMRLNPRSDGHVIYVPTPKVTKEYRNNLVKTAKGFFNKYHDRIRNIRNANFKVLHDRATKDAIQRLEESIDALFKQYVDKGSKMLEIKQKELISDSD